MSEMSSPSSQCACFDVVCPQRLALTPLLVKQEGIITTIWPFEVALC